MGRPTKIEGNPEHPASLGATDVFAQASMLQLYDPDRSQVVKHVGRISTWESFLVAMRTELEAQKAQDGAGVRILTGTITSPTLASQLKKCLARYPLAKWHQYEPVGRDNFKAGAQLAFGEFVDCQYNFEDADVILSLDGDFLIFRPHKIFRVAVAAQAPFHVKRMFTPGQRHFAYRPVTGLAANTLFYVNAVIEINIIRQVMHPNPFQRLARPPAFAHRLQHLCGSVNLRVAGHACLGRRNAGKITLFNRSVAVAAVNAQLRHMVPVTERHLLLPHNLGLRDVGRPFERQENPRCRCQNKYAPKNRDF